MQVFRAGRGQDYESSSSCESNLCSCKTVPVDFSSQEVRILSWKLSRVRGRVGKKWEREVTSPLSLLLPRYNANALDPGTLESVGRRGCSTPVEDKPSKHSLYSCCNQLNWFKQVRCRTLGRAGASVATHDDAWKWEHGYYSFSYTSAPLPTASHHRMPLPPCSHLGVSWPPRHIQTFSSRRITPFLWGTKGTKLNTVTVRGCWGHLKGWELSGAAGTLVGSKTYCLWCQGAAGWLKQRCLLFDVEVGEKVGAPKALTCWWPPSWRTPWPAGNQLQCLCGLSPPTPWRVE